MLRHLPPQGGTDPHLLVGLESGDDAGVYRLTDRLALVQTVDFFTPIVDDPTLFGEIAAANALSDVYAMGGRPLTALNLVGFSVSRYGAETLAAILAGGAAKVREAGAVIVGGHTIDDAEPKYGLAVTGVVEPDRIWTNRGARPGDVVILTKPIGTGVVSTALKRDLAPPEAVAAMVAMMRTLNRAAAEAGQAVGGVHAATDVTGFGLVGHASHIARESGVALVVEAEAVPVLPGARELAEKDVFPGGSRANRRHYGPVVVFRRALPEWQQGLLFDAVTSGGLLLVVEPARAAALLDELHGRGVREARVIGRVEEGPAGRVLVE